MMDSTDVWQLHLYFLYHIKHTPVWLLLPKMTDYILSPLVNRGVSNLGGMDESVLGGRCQGCAKCRDPCRDVSRLIFGLAASKPFCPIWKTEEFSKS